MAQTESLIASPMKMKMTSEIKSEEPTVCQQSAVKADQKVSVAKEVPNEPIHVAGRYNKYSRDLSQTPWILDGRRVKETSVQDLIQDKILEFIECDRAKFSSSGREDVDVRMLGRGRPFVFKLINPKITSYTKQQMQEIMSAINRSQTDVFVRDLQMVSKDSISSDLKEGENLKKKTYQALCCLSRPLTDEDIELVSKLGDLVIHQKTPLRVLHRRTLFVRDRHIYEMSAERAAPIDIPDEHKDYIDRIFKLTLTTEAGTYIKEFVHSDFGRTQPSLASLLGNCSADIIQLDVMDIDIDWPPVVDTNS